MPKVAIKPNALNPLWALLALRSVNAIKDRLIGVRSDAWGIMPGLYAAHPDPDRSPSKWTDVWHETVRQRLSAVQGHPLLAVPPPPHLGPDPSDLARSLADGEIPEGVHWNADPARPVGAVDAVGWRMPLPALASGWPEDVLERLLDPRALGQQVWLVVPAQPNGWDWWSEDRFKDSLRWGASWWFEPPSSKEGWEGYSSAMVSATRRLLGSPDAEQWVWPVADLLQQALEEVMRTGGLHSRAGAPWGGGCTEEWNQLRRAVWAAAQDSFGGSGALEDATAGIVFSSIRFG